MNQSEQWTSFFTSSRGARLPRNLVDNALLLRAPTVSHSSPAYAKVIIHTRLNEHNTDRGFASMMGCYCLRHIAAVWFGWQQTHSPLHWCTKMWYLFVWLYLYNQKPLDRRRGIQCVLCNMQLSAAHFSAILKMKSLHPTPSDENFSCIWC